MTQRHLRLFSDGDFWLNKKVTHVRMNVAPVMSEGNVHESESVSLLNSLRGAVNLPAGKHSG